MPSRIEIVECRELCTAPLRLERQLKPSSAICWVTILVTWSTVVARESSAVTRASWVRVSPTCGGGTSPPSVVGDCNHWSSYNFAGQPGNDDFRASIENSRHLALAELVGQFRLLDIVRSGGTTTHAAIIQLKQG